MKAFLWIVYFRYVLIMYNNNLLKNAADVLQNIETSRIPLTHPPLTTPFSLLFSYKQVFTFRDLRFKEQFLFSYKFEITWVLVNYNSIIIILSLLYWNQNTNATWTIAYCYAMIIIMSLLFWNQTDHISINSM